MPCVFNLPLIFYYVSQIILNQSDRIMINYYQGSGKAAVYSVGVFRGDSDASRPLIHKRIIQSVDVQKAEGWKVQRCRTELRRSYVCLWEELPLP